jgi:hypothetical protein
VPRRERVAWTALALAPVAVVLLPWAAYNSARFHHPVLMGTEFGITVAISNCDPVYSGSHIGFQDADCATKVSGTNDSQRDSEYLHLGLDYVRAHSSRVPVVILAREARAWGLLPSQLHLDTSRGTGYHIILLGYFVYWLLVPFAIAGVVILHRRGVTSLPLVAFFVGITVGVALTYGYTRFRAAAEVPLVLLAAVALSAVTSWITA